ncbi:hypothetical protein V5O48_019556, partial [Marasmius crinis-equi]
NYIGGAVSEIGQHSNPYRNLSERSVTRAAVNCLKLMDPSFDDDADMSGTTTVQPDDEGEDDGDRDADIEVSGSGKSIGGGYVLLPRHDKVAREFENDLEGDALYTYLGTDTECNRDAEELDWSKVRRWARLRLPNGYQARSLWKESRMKNPRCARNVK